jgi:hypothetical protein
VTVRVETLTPDELRARLVIVPEWIQTVLDRAREAGKLVEYESMRTPFGTYPIRVRVAEEQAP